jgi:hypothetical protein
MTTVKGTRKTVKNKRARVKSAAHERVASDVNIGIPKRFVLDVPHQHHCTLLTCLIDGRPFPGRNRVLVARLAPGQQLAGKWEFPGGKIESVLHILAPV